MDVLLSELLIFKDPDRSKKRELYREYLALMYEYALRRDRSGLLATLDEPTDRKSVV